MSKIAIIRGRYLNKFEMQTFESLSKDFNITAFGSLSSYHTDFSFPVARFLSPIDVLELTSKVKIPKRYVLGILNRVCLDANYLFGLEEKLKGFDIAHPAETYLHFSHQAIRAKRKKIIKNVVLTVWETIPFNHEGIWGRREMKAKVISGADRFIAVSKKAKKALLSEGAEDEKIAVIPPGIDLDVFTPFKRDEKNQLTVLFSGRLVNEKGIYELIEAIRMLKSKYNGDQRKVKFVIIGEGEQKDDLLRLEIKYGIRSMITHKSLEYSQMPREYQEADIFVAPSKRTKYWEEQFGMSILEAQASGLPIITTDTGAIKENVGENAIFVPEANGLALAKEIDNMVNNAKERLMMGKLARMRAETHFDVRIIAKKIENVYKELLLK